MNVKEFIDQGGSISIPYKKRLLDWYDDHGLSLTKARTIKPDFTGWAGIKYCVRSQSIADLKFDTFEEAWEEFKKYKYNIGAMQALVSQDNPGWDDVESFADEYRKAIKKKRAEFKKQDRLQDKLDAEFEKALSI